MSDHKNFVRMSVSGTPGTGTITLGSAVSGYQSLASAYGANATVDVSITDGTAWEVARDCTYTHSGTTLTRGTFEASSTGSAISLTSAAIVTVTAVASKGNTLEAMRKSGFLAYADGTTQQNLTTGTGTTLIHGGTGGALQTEEFDIEGWFTKSTGIFFPQEAGLWLIGASAVYGTIADAAYVAVYISHSTDGTTWSDSDDKGGIAWRGYSAAAGANIGGSGSLIVNANGTTDRWALRLFHTDAGTPKVPATASVRGWAKFWARRIGVSS